MTQQNKAAPAELPGGGRTVAVLGAGTMGHGIAQIFACAGYGVRLYDNQQSILRSGPERIARSLAVFASLDMITETEIEDSLARVELCPRVEDACQGACPPAGEPPR